MLEEHHGRARGSPLTLARYRTLITVHVLPGIGDVPLKDLTGKTIDAFYAGRRTEGKRYGGGLSSSTALFEAAMVNDEHQAMKRLTQPVGRCEVSTASSRLWTSAMARPRASLSRLIRRWMSGPCLIEPKPCSRSCERMGTAPG